MEMQDGESRLRGLQLIEAYSTRNEDGMDEVVDAVAALQDAEGIDTGSAIYALLIDVLGASEYLDYQMWQLDGMPDDALPGWLRREVIARETSSQRSLRQAEDGLNSAIRRHMTGARTEPE